MNAKRVTEAAQEEMTARLAARSCYRECIGLAVTVFQDKKAKMRDRLLAALILQRAADWGAAEE